MINLLFDVTIKTTLLIFWVEEQNTIRLLVQESLLYFYRIWCYFTSKILLYCVKINKKTENMDVGNKWKHRIQYVVMAYISLIQTSFTKTFIIEEKKLPKSKQFLTTLAGNGHSATAWKSMLLLHHWRILLTSRSEIVAFGNGSPARSGELLKPSLFTTRRRISITRCSWVMTEL